MRTLVVVSCALAVLAGCGGRRRVERPRDEWLAEIRIEGNRAIERDELIPRLALDRTRTAGRGVDAYQLEVDTQRLRAAYLRRGFFDVAVTARVDTAARAGTTAQTVVFTVVEGRRSTIRVEIVGLPPGVEATAARRLIRLADGDPFDYGVYDDAKQPLIALVEDEGYPQVTLDAAVVADRARAVATARYTLDAGPRARFGEITIDGVGGKLAAAIRSRLRIATGRPYSRSALEASQRAIYTLGRFSAVRIEPDRTSGSVVRVRIAVTVGNRHELRVGGGFGRDPLTYEARLRLGYSVIPEDHPLTTVNVDLQPAVSIFHDGVVPAFDDPRLRFRGLGSIQRLDLFRPHLRGEVEGTFDFLRVEAFTMLGPRVRAGFASPLGATWLQGRVGWLFEYLWLTDTRVVEAALPDLNLDRNQRRGAFELSLDADLRDNSVDVTRGVFASLRATYGTPYALGATRYVQVTPEVRGYASLPAHIVLALRGRIGLVYGDVPATERYFAGGASSHRGFAARELSPTVTGAGDGDPTQVVIGGVALIETGAELRIPFGDTRFGTTVFLDGGDVVADRTALDPSHLHWAAGLGLYARVIGLKIRADVGARLNRTGPGEPAPGVGFWENLAWHLSVGDSY